MPIMDTNKQPIEPLSIFVFDTVSIRDTVVTEVIFERITTWRVLGNEDNGLVVSVSEYRKLTGDNKSTDERIVEKLQFLQAFCRNVISMELKRYDTK